MRLPAPLQRYFLNMWVAFAKYILRVPYMIMYVPGPDRDRIEGITFTWTIDYAQMVQNGYVTRNELWEAQQKIKELEAKLDGGTEQSTDRPTANN